MTATEQDRSARYEAWLMSKLMQCTPGEVPAFREAHLAMDRDVALHDLMAVKACLSQLSNALHANVPSLWKLVHQAAATLGAAVEADVTVEPVSAAQPALPFRGARSAPPIDTRTLAPPELFGGTDEMTPYSGAVLPFDAADAVVSVGTTSLTLEHYAQLTAVGAGKPREWPEHRAAYGIPDDETYAALARAWQTRFARDPELQRRWLRTYQRALSGGRR